MKELSQEERKRIAEEYLADRAKENRKKELEKERYEKRRDKFVSSNFAKLQKLSNQMLELKNKIFQEAAEIIEIKNEMFSVKDGRRSDTFTTASGSISIKLGNRVYEGWDDKAEIGIEKVKQYLTSLSKDEETAVLVETVLGLLAKDRKGTLKASKVLELQRIANKIKDPLFLEGIQMISDAYRPNPSCLFIEVRYKDEQGVERSLPLSMSAMDIRESVK